MDRLLQIHNRLLQIHIESKTTGTQFHKDTEKAYELAFDVFHLLSEMRQNLWLDENTDCEESGQEAYDLLEEMKSFVYDLAASNKDVGYDNLIRSLAERLADMCGTFKQYTKKQEEEEEQEEIDEESLANWQEMSTENWPKRLLRGY